MAASVIARRFGPSLLHAKAPLSIRSSMKLFTAPTTQARYINIPKDLKYSKEHYWVRLNSSGPSRMGITDWGQRQMGDIVFVEIAEKTAPVGNEIGTIESVKAVAEIYAPVTLNSITVNPVVADEPEELNSDPYGDGYLVEFKGGANFKKEYADLLSPEDYEKLIQDGE